MFDLQIKIGQPHGGIAEGAEGAEGAPWLLSKCRGRAVCPVSLLDFLLNLFFVLFFWFPIPSLLALPCGTQTVSERARVRRCWFVSCQCEPSHTHGFLCPMVSKGLYTPWSHMGGGGLCHAGSLRSLPQVRSAGVI
jgi:hypothetical protein